METGTQSNPVKLPKALRNSPTTAAPQRPKKIIGQILEESKRLESLYRQIAKTSNQRIMKYLSDYRKSASPDPRSNSNLEPAYSNLYDNAIKKPQDSFKYGKNPSEICSELGDKEKVYNNGKLQNKNSLNNEFDSIGFKQILWPEESIIDDALFQAMTGIEKNNFEEKSMKIHTAFGNRKIQSRIGHYSRRYTKREGKNFSESYKKTPLRVSTPWTYSNNNGNACLFNPYV